MPFCSAIHRNSSASCDDMERREPVLVRESYSSCMAPLHRVRSLLTSVRGMVLVCSTASSCAAFSRMRSKGSRFTLGVWGLRVCSLDVAEPFATVRNRPQPFVRGPYGRAYGKFCRGGHFWRFQTCRCFVSRGRRGTL